MITLENITAGYDGRTVLHGVNLTLRRNTLTCLVGPNGCGKSTLLQVAAGLLPYTGGSAIVDKVPLTQLADKQRALQIAYLPQSRNTPAITARRMVLHGRFPHLQVPRRYTAADDAAVESALVQVGAAHLAHKDMTALSGGERQRIYLAMALAQDTDAILLDEPTTYLDIDHQLQIMQLARQLAAVGKAVCVVTHDLAGALHTAHTVCVLANGQNVCAGTPQQIYEQHALEQVFRIQAHCVDGHYFFTSKQ